MGLKDTVKTIDVEKVEKQAKQVGRPKTRGPQIEKTSRFNVELPKSYHWKFKAICSFEEVPMKDKALEILKNWIDQQPDVFK